MTTQRRTLFKVVDKETRRGTNFAISKFWAFIYNPSVYINTYERDTVVRAKEGSLGIFTFKTKKAAREFIERYGSLKHITILRVKPIGKGKTPTEIVLGGSVLNSILDFYSGKFCKKVPPPQGTICYPAVKVLN